LSILVILGVVDAFGHKWHFRIGIHCNGGGTWKCAAARFPVLVDR
jgi:hypothetical protein